MTYPRKILLSARDPAAVSNVILLARYFRAQAGVEVHIVASNPAADLIRPFGEKIIQLDPLNPQIAARLVTPFTTWKRYDTSRQTLMRKELETILAEKTLSRDVFEIVNKIV